MSRVVEKRGNLRRKVGATCFMCFPKTVIIGAGHPNGLLGKMYHIIRRMAMKELGIVLFLAIAVMGILLIVLLHKITILKKQTDDIVEEVKAYVAFVTADPDTDVEGINKNMKESPNENLHRLGQAQYVAGKERKQASRDEMESHLIQAVLGEYFP